MEGGGATAPFKILTHPPLFLLSTSQRYLSDLFKKTGTGRRTELVRWALKNGFVDVESG